MEEVKVDIKKFVAFHKKRIKLLEELLERKNYGRLIFQISFLGLESLARLLYQEERDPSKRFILLLSLPNIGIGKKEANHLYGFWRNSLIHQGFIANHWTTLESWNDEDDSFLIFQDKQRSSVEYHPGSIIGIYRSMLNHFENHFKDYEFLDFIDF